MGNDLNTSMGVTALFDVLKAKTNDATKLALIGDFDSVLSLGLLEKAAAKRAEAAQAKTTQTESGYTVTGEGTRPLMRWCWRGTRRRRRRTLRRRTASGMS